MTRFRFKNNMSGEDVVKRAMIEKLKVGKCSACGINTYLQEDSIVAPPPQYLPCGIEDCPYGR